MRWRGRWGWPGIRPLSSQAANKHYVDTAVAGVSTALAQKVGVAPTTTQTVAQPGGNRDAGEPDERRAVSPANM